MSGNRGDTGWIGSKLRNPSEPCWTLTVCGDRSLGRRAGPRAGGELVIEDDEEEGWKARGAGKLGLDRLVGALVLDVRSTKPTEEL